MVKQFLKERLGTIILFVILAIFLVWGYFSIQKARSNAITFTDEYEEPEGNVDFENEGKYVSVAKTDKLELFYNDAKGAIQVKNLESGYLWKGICDNDVYDMSGGSVNKMWKSYLQSPITITYNNLKRRDSGARTEYAGKDCKWLETEYIDNGVSVTYGFTTPGIYVTVEYTLDDDQLVVRVPTDKIQEKARFAVTTIELLPYLGASRNEAGGYLFYPDGSGAITTYEKADTRPSNVLGASYYTYTNRFLAFQNLFDFDSYSRYTAAMPVYGIKNGDDAMFAVFTEGAENTGVVVYPSGYVVDLNHAGFEIYTRNVYNVNAYSMSTAEGSATGGSIQRVDKYLIPENREARYFFLSGEDADYGGMAATYRDYLVERGLLKEAIASGEEMPLALRLLMGTTKGGMVFDEYVTMTDFDQVQEILGRLSDAGITSTEVVLTSWMKGYDEYEYWGPARQLGGTGGLKDLNKYLETAAGNRVYLDNAFMFASSETSGISEKDDVAYDGLNLEISATNMDGTVFYLVNPLAAYKRNLKFLDKLEKYDLLGVAYSDVGQYAYADFNEAAPYTKTATVTQLKELLASTADTNRRIASQGANQYVYGYTDYLFDLREESYGFSITDYAVPFLQMVVSGRIPYSTEGAGNLSYDLQTQKLKWIEYGAIPYFYLTYESALKLRDTGYQRLFSSTYDDWEGVMVDTYKEFRDNLSCVYGVQMTDHNYLTDDLIRIDYANGIAIYINYGGEEAEAEGVTVPAKGYVVVEGGER